MQHVGGVGVPEGDVGNLDGPRRREVDRAGPLHDRRRGVEQVEELVQRRARRLHDVVLLAQLLDRLEQVVEVQHEGGNGADGDDALLGEVAPEADDPRGRGDAEPLHEREVPGGDAEGLDVGLELRLVRGRGTAR